METKKKEKKKARKEKKQKRQGGDTGRGMWHGAWIWQTWNEDWVAVVLTAIRRSSGGESLMAPGGAKVASAQPGDNKPGAAAIAASHWSLSLDTRSFSPSVLDGLLPPLAQAQAPPQSLEPQRDWVRFVTGRTVELAVDSADTKSCLGGAVAAAVPASASSSPVTSPASGEVLKEWRKLQVETCPSCATTFDYLHHTSKYHSAT